MWGVELAVMLAMIAFNGVFAGYEIALASLPLPRLRGLAEQKRRGAAAALYMKENIEGSLAGVQLGITLFGAIAAATGGAGAGERIAPLLREGWGLSEAVAGLLAIAFVVAPLTYFTILFGELIPKVVALRNQEWLCLRLSPPMRWFVLTVWPIVWLLENSVDVVLGLASRLFRRNLGESSKSEELQDLRASVSSARMSRLIGPREERIMLGAAALSHRTIREVMLPAEAITMLQVDAPASEGLVDAHMDMHTRFPVTERAGDPQGIIGYVNFKDIVARLRLAPRDGSLRSITRAIPSLGTEERVASVLERLIRGRTHIALVRDSERRVVGMVTLEDIIEELVGDIEDEFDRLPTHVVRSGSGWVVGGGASPVKIHETIGLDLPRQADGEPVRHLSDWVAARLDAPIRGGEVLDKDGLRVVVRKVRRQKVLEAQVDTLRNGEPQPAGDPDTPATSTHD